MNAKISVFVIVLKPSYVRYYITCVTVTLNETRSDLSKGRYKAYHTSEFLVFYQQILY